MTLYEILHLHAGLTTREAQRIHRIIKKQAGAPRPRSTPAFVLEGKQYQLTRLVRSRVEGDEGAVLIIKNITL